MKKITLLILLLTVSLGYSQDLLQDFEDANGLGATFGQLTSATLVADPASGGTNGTVAEIISSAAGEVWQGVNVDIDSNVLLNATDGLTMTIDVYSTAAIDILVKVTASSDGGPDSSTPVSHTGSGWETLTATFNTGSDGTAPANGTYTNFVVYPNWDGGANGYINPAIVRTVYFDNIMGNAAAVDSCANGVQDGDETGVDCGGSCPNACPMTPTTPAPAPPSFDASNVISFYSDAYTNVTSNFDAGWCGVSSVEEVMIVGNNTMRYLANPCQGIDFAGDRRDATAFNRMHIDFYTTEANLAGKVFNLKLTETR